MTKKSDKELLDATEKVLMGVMNSDSATLKEKMDAAGHAMRLMQIKHKIDGVVGDEGSFFKKG